MSFNYFSSIQTTGGVQCCIYKLRISCVNSRNINGDDDVNGGLPDSENGIMRSAGASK